MLDGLQVGEAYDTVSLDAPRPSDDGGAVSRLEAIGDEDDRLVMVDDQATIFAAAQDLPERERQILFLRFGEDLTQTEIAERVGVSQMQVSRLLRRSLQRLRDVCRVTDGSSCDGRPARPGRVGLALLVRPFARVLLIGFARRRSGGRPRPDRGVLVIRPAECSSPWLACSMSSSSASSKPSDSPSPASISGAWAGSSSSDRYLVARSSAVRRCPPPRQPRRPPARSRIQTRS